MKTTGNQPNIMTDTTRTPDSFDPSIPVLTDVVVPGKPDFARVAAGGDAAAAFEPRPFAQEPQGRIAQFLNGDARALIEARCADVLREHSARLAQDIAREVALALEGRVREWVAAEVEEALRRQRG